ncbi:hypothetical protein MF271_04945 [Deinococcus sp. KNUC1210]|uniref:hypothetical protein n=1 Tax=Deinococcus sp. KNUC1210 TaxID=2917691 RepID=UPI001EF055DF|nr:hypothetical protein [Deinococcus sp. KNUC1210]ULH15982.1 hypothetical protein MF271_04945 [Deinococcus sp. KNUC1210]
MKWITVAVALGAIAGVFNFQPTLGESIHGNLPGKSIARKCPSGKGLILNGTYQLMGVAENSLSVECTTVSKTFKDLMMKINKTSWAEYFTVKDATSAIWALADTEVYLKRKGWRVVIQRDDNDIHAGMYKRDGKRVFLYTFIRELDKKAIFALSGD